MTKRNYLLILGITTIMFYACKEEASVPEPAKCDATYSKDIKPIIDVSCAYSGCHSGATAGAYVPAGSKDYTNYDSLASNLNNGNFEKRVLILKDMPNSKFVKDPHPKQLTDAQLELITCWKDKNYPR